MSPIPALLLSTVLIINNMLRCISIMLLLEALYYEGESYAAITLLKVC
jgi:hypothetical protein